jgi:hypothetical protein
METQQDITTGQTITVTEPNFTTTGTVVGTEIVDGITFVICDFGGSQPGRIPMIDGNLPPTFTVG